MTLCLLYNDLNILLNLLLPQKSMGSLESFNGSKVFVTEKLLKSHLL